MRWHLRHSLDLKHARHERPRREVAGEEVVVHSNVLDADSILSGNVLDNTVHEQKREAVWQAVHNLIDVQDAGLQRPEQARTGSDNDDKLGYRFCSETSAQARGRVVGKRDRA